MAGHKEKIFLSFDVEFDGPSPSVNSCMQFGFVACKYDKNATENKLSWIIDELSVCLKQQPDRVKSEETTKFWSKFSKISERIYREAIDPKEAMGKCQEWLNKLYSKYDIEWVAHPATCDWQWFVCLYYYYVDQSKNTFTLPYKAKCMSSMIDTILAFGYNKDEFYEYVSPKKLQHTHYALDDAREQAYTYQRVLKFISNNSL
jgi:hypothetical protein